MIDEENIIKSNINNIEKLDNLDNPDNLSEKNPINNKTEDSLVDEIQENNQENKEENKEEIKLDPIQELQKKLEISQEESKQNYDKYLRLYAEFENYKKRSAREIDNFRKFANESILKDMILIMNNLERAVNSTNCVNNNQSILDGINITIKEMLKIFEKFGVKPIESVGKAFDPCFHQAMMQEESDKYPENTVIKEFEKGYLIHDRLLKPSVVIVSKAKPIRNIDTI